MGKSGLRQVNTTSVTPVNGSPADSGLTCLLILARFHDLPADGAQLRHQFALSGQVLTDTDLLRAAKHLGLKAGLHKAEWNSLPATPLPAMVKRTDGGYVVLAKVEAEKVLVQDPIEGRPVVLSREQFEAMWTGELLLVTKRAQVCPQDLTFDFTWFISRDRQIPQVFRRSAGCFILPSAFRAVDPALYTSRHRQGPCP